MPRRALRRRSSGFGTPIVRISVTTGACCKSSALFADQQVHRPWHRQCSLADGAREAQFVASTVPDAASPAGA
jgi:hypothetical protein